MGTRRKRVVTARHKEPGHDGGRVVFAGTPAALDAARFTLAGQRLAAYVGA